MNPRLCEGRAVQSSPVAEAARVRFHRPLGTPYLALRGVNVKIL